MSELRTKIKEIRQTKRNKIRQLKAEFYAQAEPIKAALKEQKAIAKAEKKSNRSNYS